MHARCVTLCLALLFCISSLVAAAPAMHKIAVLDLEQDGALSPSENAYLGDGLRAVFAASLSSEASVTAS